MASDITPSTESALLIDCCKKIRALPMTEAALYVELPAILAEALKAAEERGRAERDWEWWETLACVDGVEPEPAAVKRFLLAIESDMCERPKLAAMEVLMGGPGWQRHYECAHGVTMLDRCDWATCPHDVVREVLRSAAIRTPPLPPEHGEGG